MTPLLDDPLAESIASNSCPEHDAASGVETDAELVDWFAGAFEALPAFQNAATKAFATDSLT